MVIKTSAPIIKSRSDITRKISMFWDRISPGMRMVWGPHIHHGYYETGTDPSPVEAQELLIERLAGLLKIKKKSMILDAGCGMGGSSIYLSKKFDARVLGITVSPVQVKMAMEAAASEKAAHVSFEIGDALDMEGIDDGLFDLVWSLESCEQFYDKGLFLKQARRVLKKNGDLMLATWCSGSEEYSGHRARAYRRLALAFDLPYMPAMDYYRALLEQNGFRVLKTLDLSQAVKKSWDIGINAVNAYSFLRILRVAGIRGLLFTRQIRYMQRAFQSGMVKYGVFICRKK